MPRACFRGFPGGVRATFRLCTFGTRKGAPSRHETYFKRCLFCWTVGGRVGRGDGLFVFFTRRRSLVDIETTGAFLQCIGSQVDRTTFWRQTGPSSPPHRWQTIVSTFKSSDCFFFFSSGNNAARSFAQPRGVYCKYSRYSCLPGSFPIADRSVPLCPEMSGLFV